MLAHWLAGLSTQKKMPHYILKVCEVSTKFTLQNTLHNPISKNLQVELAISVGNLYFQGTSVVQRPNAQGFLVNDSIQLACDNVRVNFAYNRQ